jgi:hypothetical protein
MKGKLMWGIIVLVLALAVVPLSCSSTEEGGTPSSPGSGYIGPGFDDRLDGEVNIVLADHEPGTCQELYLKRGEEGDVPILLHFDSYNPEVTEVPISIDPVNGSYSWEVCYGILDDEGNEIGEGSFSSRQILSYNVSGTVVIKANETLPLTMTIRIPEDLPKRISRPSFDIWGAAAGICVPPEIQHMGGANSVRIEVHIVD